MRKEKGPRFVRYLGPVLVALRDLGGSGRPSEVVEHVAQQLRVSDAERSELLPSGSPRFENMVAWARFYLTKAGLLDASRRGVWALTDKGRSEGPLSEGAALAVFREIHAKQTADWRSRTAEKTVEQDAAPDDTSDTVDTGHRAEVLRILMTLPAAGFERFCQRLLRESGFEEVTVTGRSGDEGIDGIGLLQVNRLVSFKVLFQCKRYRKAVSPTHVRDFRGAMMGRADKGIIITTGTFTVEARREAVRDGVPAIELVDQEKLLTFLEELELGLTKVHTYRVEHDFFEDFRVED